jgi:hypothetical protein
MSALGQKQTFASAPPHVRFTPECVAKLFAALRARNNRILVDGATNQRCALSSDVESMFRQQPLKIVLQHIPPESGHWTAQPVATDLSTVLLRTPIPHDQNDQ